MLRGPTVNGKTPQPPACPQCGKLLMNHAFGSEMDGHGKPELVKVYFCYVHGFFTFRTSKGLQVGL